MPENLQSHRQAGFRNSLGAINKRDRHLQHPDALAMKSPQDLFEVSVSLGLNSINFDRLQSRSAIDAERSAVVACWQTQKDARKSVHQPRRQVPEIRPALDSASSDVATSDRDADSVVGFFPHCVDHGPQRFGSVTEVGVHGRDEIETMLKGETESFHRGRTQSKFSGPMDALKRSICRFAITTPGARSVGRVVIDDKNLHFGDQTLQLLDQPRKVFPFVVGGNDRQQTTVWRLR